MSSKEIKQCVNCYVRGTVKRLQKCSRCRMTLYCSSECQRTHWKAHKPYCTDNSTLFKQLKDFAETPLGRLETMLLPDGITCYELDLRLEKWVKFHTPIMMWALYHSLELQNNILRAQTHVLYLKLRARTAQDHGGSPAKYFEAADAYPVSVKEGLTWPKPWPESMEGLKEFQDDAAKTGRWFVSALMVQCPPLAVQIVPFKSIRPVREPVQSSWKEKLFEEIKEGRNFPPIQADTRYQGC